jgi:hypothetical protein
MVLSRERGRSVVRACRRGVLIAYTNIVTVYVNTMQLSRIIYSLLLRYGSPEIC